MNETVKKNLIKFGVATLIGALLAYVVTVMQGYNEAEEFVVRLRILADAFTIPGVIITLSGVLVWVVGEGAFDGLTYSLSWAFRALIPFGRSGKQERYYDYVERRRQRGKLHGYSFLFIVGGVFMAISVFFIVLFYVNY